MAATTAGGVSMHRLGTRELEPERIYRSGTLFRDDRAGKLHVGVAGKKRSERHLALILWHRLVLRR